MDRALLAGRGAGGDVNGHPYTPAEIDAALARPVVQALGRLIRFRNGPPAFAGRMTCSGNGSSIVMSWARDDDEATLRADLATGSAEVTWTENGDRRRAPLASLP